MRGVIRRLSAAERRLNTGAAGSCSHLPPIIEYRSTGGEILVNPYGEPKSDYARQEAARREAEKVPDDVVCWCGRDRLKIVVQFTDEATYRGEDAEGQEV